MNVVIVFEDILREKQKGEIEKGFPVWGILAMGVLGPPLAVVKWRLKVWWLVDGRAGFGRR